MDKTAQYKTVLKKHVYFILVFTAVVLLTTALVNFLMPKSYRSSTSIFRPQESQLSLEWIKAVSQVERELAPQITTNIDLFLSILKSRSMKDEIIRKFNLIQVYGAKDMDEAREILEASTRIDISKEKMIVISVRDRNAARSAAIANFYVENLDKSIKDLNIITAKRNRMFIEERLEETSKVLNNAEQKLKDFQVNNVVVVSKEGSQVAEIANELESNLLKMRVQLETMKIYATDQNPEVIGLKKKIVETEKVISELPGIENTLSKLLREVRMQERTYSLLTEQLEQAKIAEAKDTPTVQVLDPAIVPERVYRPDVKLNFGIAGIVVLSAAVILFFFDIIRFVGNL